MSGLLSKLNDRLIKLLLHAPIPYYPFMFGLLLFLIGLWIALPWQVYTFSNAFSWVAGVIPELCLGTIGMLGGLSLVLGAITSHKGLTRLGMLVSFYFWGFLAVSFGLGNWKSPGFPWALWMNIMSGFAWVNRKVRQNLLFED